MQSREQLYALVRLIPRGRVASYGSLGRCLANPVSGLIVGRWMASCPDDIPWWRVVAADGSLPLTKRDPVLGHQQKHHLEQEGVMFSHELVVMESAQIDAGDLGL